MIRQFQNEENKRLREGENEKREKRGSPGKDPKNRFGAKKSIYAL